MSVGEDTVVADSDEAGGEDVEEEALDELEGRQRHCAGLVVLLRISVLEGDPVPFQVEETAIGDGDAVGVCAEVLYDVFGSTEGGLAVDIPFYAVEFGQECVEGGLWCEVGDVSRESNLPGVVGVFEVCEELSPEEF